MWAVILHHTSSPMLPTQVRAMATHTGIVCLLLISRGKALKVFTINAFLCCDLSLHDCVCLVTH